MSSLINAASGADVSAQFAVDANGLNSLKRSAKENSPEAIKGVAKQFEGIFMNMMLKSMRDATPKDGMTDNEQTKMFTSMLDQQLSQTMAQKGVGLSDVLARQLTKTTQKGGVSTLPMSAPAAANGGQVNAAVANPTNNNTPAMKSKPVNTVVVPPAAPRVEHADQAQRPWTDKAAQAIDQIRTSADNLVTSVAKTVKGVAAEFAQKMQQFAEQASAATGVPANYMIGQAALESGWGKRVIKAPDGTLSHNLFGIKATANWTGKTVTAVTTEYVNGVKEQRVEKFRAYDSYEDSFKDFANLMMNNPRYKNVLENLHSPVHFANAIQKSGYATDPNYAGKLTGAINKVNQANSQPPLTVAMLESPLTFADDKPLNADLARAYINKA